MIRSLARIWAKLAYIWRLETEAANNDINSRLAAFNAGEKRKLVEQLNADADTLQANIKSQQEKLEKGIYECEDGHEQDQAHPQAFCNVPTGNPEDKCRKPVKLIKLDLMYGKERYELEKDRKDAENLLANKRQQAKSTADDVSNGESAAQHFRALAANGRAVAEKVRKL